MNIFDSIGLQKPKRNKFDLSHHKKLSMNMGELIPILTEEVIPGDSFQVNSEIMLRMAPMVAPVMHRFDVRTEFFFVPNRLLWVDWENFITGGEDGLDASSPPVFQPSQQSSSYFALSSLADYFGIPITPGAEEIAQITVSALPFRAYQQIYEDYYRDQNLTPKNGWAKDGGIQQTAQLAKVGEIRIRAWEKDYFTSALPFPQRGQEAILPLGTVDPNYKTISTFTPGLETPLDPHAVGPASFQTESGANSQLADSLGIPTRVENLDTMPVDPITINELRKANRLQTWLEKSARAGSRYVEQIKSHFGITSSDARLQRAEYLGGGKQPISISEVLNQAGDGDGATLAPVGEMSGHGVSYGGKNGFKKSFEEHGWIIGLLSVMPKAEYIQGLDRKWSRETKFDYYWPEFAHLGEQEILNKEIFVDYTDPIDSDTTWGYQQRYAEYKYAKSSVHGDFRDTLDFWHYARKFTGLPPLNENFIKMEDDNRIYAVKDETDKLYVQIYNHVSALRPMPYFSIPSL